MISWYYWVGWICSLGLEGIALFLRFRRQLGEANRAVAEANRTIADKDKIIADKDKIIAETKILEVDQELKKLEVKTVHFKIQDQLDAENKHYKDAQDVFTSRLNEMSWKIQAHADASASRNAAIKAIEDVIDAFSTYMERAKTYYLGSAPELIESLVESEVVSFLSELSSAVSTLNSDAIVETCHSSKARFEISLASLGSVDRALLELLPKLDHQVRTRLCALITNRVGGLSVQLRSVAQSTSGQ